MMKPMAGVVFSLGLVIAAATTANAQATELTCDEWRCEFQDRVEARCPCSEQTNHGRYVSCVAHVVKELVADGLPTRCKGKLKRCAAKSVCGKEGFSTCTIHEYGTCVEGVCSHDSNITCSADTDCLVSSQCRITRDTARCEAAGGVANLSPTCCSSCNTGE